MKNKKNNSRNKNSHESSNFINNNFDIDNDFFDDFDMGSDNDDLRVEFGDNTESSDHDVSNTNVELPTRLRGNINTTTCQQLADIIGGIVITATPVCVVQRLRNINATILGRRTRSPLALPFALSFENNIRGRTLNLGETVILQREINPFLTALRKRGITVTALHNHWLFEEPRLMYMHWEQISDPFEFAQNSIGAAREAGLF